MDPKAWHTNSLFKLKYFYVQSFNAVNQPSLIVARLSSYILRLGHYIKWMQKLQWDHMGTVNLNQNVTMLATFLTVKRGKKCKIPIR